MELNKIYNMCCLEGMASVPDNSVDLVLCDLPYGTTDLKWDNIIPLDELWEHYKRIVRPNGWVLLTGQNPFTAQLVMSNPNDYSHQWIWEKPNGANPFNAKIAPLKNFEDVICFQNTAFADNDYEKSHPLREYARKCVGYINKEAKQLITDFKRWYPNTAGSQWSHFMSPDSLQFTLPTEKTYQLLIDNYGLNEMEGFRGFADLKQEQDEWRQEQKKKRGRTYNPQMTKIKPYTEKKTNSRNTLRHVGEFKPKECTVTRTEKYPKAIVKFNYDKEKYHPTQKPQALFEYLIKTYSNEGDTVLDSCMGSGTTAVAALATNRNFIGFETDGEYFEIANKRIEEARKQRR